MDPSYDRLSILGNLTFLWFLTFMFWAAGEVGGEGVLKIGLLRPRPFPLLAVFDFLFGDFPGDFPFGRISDVCVGRELVLE